MTTVFLLERAVSRPCGSDFMNFLTAFFIAHFKVSSDTVFLKVMFSSTVPSNGVSP
jgi:hypothetical protein